MPAARHHAVVVIPALLIGLPAAVHGQVDDAQQARRAAEEQTPQPVQLYLQGGAVHQFETGLDGGGDYDVSRLYVQPGLTWIVEPALSVSFSVGYGYDSYDFSGDGPLASLRPWDDVNALRFGAAVRWAIDDRWTLYGGPSFRFNAESGADLGDGFTAGGIVGASYRFSETFAIGPGIGVQGEIEDDLSVFPVLLIDWTLADDLSLQTGRGLAATQGPGLTLNWGFAEDWELMLGGRYERLRFRLDDEGVAPQGVGEEESIPLFLGLTWTISPQATVTLLGGVNLAGEVTLEDRDGNALLREEYDSAFFLGLTFNVRF